MEKIVLTLSEQDTTDLSHGLIIAMKELDKYTKGTDRILADRLEVILKNIQKLQSQAYQNLTESDDLPV